MVKKDFAYYSKTNLLIFFFLKGLSKNRDGESRDENVMEKI